jgi:hypothetical protein
MRVDVQTTTVTLNDALREMVHRVVLLAVGRFRPLVDAVRVGITGAPGDGRAGAGYRVALRLEGPRRFVVVEHDRALSDALARAADRARRALDRERSRAALREAHSAPIGPGGRRLSGGARATAVAAD